MLGSQGDLLSQADSFDLFDQGGALQIQELGGQLLVSIRLPQTLEDQFPLQVGYDVLEVDTLFGNLDQRDEVQRIAILNFPRQVGRKNCRTVTRQRDHSLDQVFELT